MMAAVRKNGSILLKGGRVIDPAQNIDAEMDVLLRDAFVSGLKLHGLSQQPMIESGDHRIEGGAMAMRSLLLLPQRPTAVIASNDLSAIGALGAIHQAGLNVPQDISLIGFDDISFAHLTQPPLTTIVLSRTQLAVTAFAALEALIRQEDESHDDYIIPTHLVMRGSTRAI